MADPPNPKPTLHYESPTDERGSARGPVVLAFAAIHGAAAWIVLAAAVLVHGTCFAAST